MYSKRDLKDPEVRLHVYELALEYVRGTSGEAFICLFINHYSAIGLLQFSLYEENMRFHLPELWNARNKEFIKADRRNLCDSKGGLFESRIERITVLERIVRNLKEKS